MAEMDRQAHIERAKQLLKTAKHAAMATVNEDGTPHNTPFMFLYETDLSRIYWGSHPRSIHSKNIARTGEVFFVWFDAAERGGLYIKAKNAHALAGTELDAALMVHNRVRASRGQDLLKLSYYTGNSPQRMWSAMPIKFWVNGAIRDEEGHMAEDIRDEVTANELTS
jgi:hypothetical protein